MMVALVLFGMIFYRPDYKSWGVAAVALILAMLFWMLRGLHEHRNAVPGNPIQWVWLGLAVYLSGIQFLAQYFPGVIVPSSGLAGFINISVILQLLMLSLGCLLFQEFMSRGQLGRWLREISSVGIILLSLAMDSLFYVEIPHTAMWLIGCTGVMMAAANAFSSGTSRAIGISGPDRRHQIAVWGQLIIAGLGMLWLLYGCTMRAFELFFCIIVTVLGFAFVSRKWAFKSAMFYIPLGVLWWAVVMAGSLYFYYDNAGLPISFWGCGELGARYFNGSDDGVTVLLNLVGLLGVGGMFAGMVAVSMMAALKTSGPGGAHFWKSVFWLTACWMATAAWMAKKAFFCISPLPVMMMAWGLLVTIADIRVKIHRAWRFILPMALGIFWLAIANESSLFQKAAFYFGYTDFSLHKIAGAVFCVFMVWWWAKGKWWWAVPAVIVAAMAGGLGEVFQRYFSRRNEDWNDWKSHLTGLTFILPIFLFVFAARAGLVSSDGKVIFVNGGWKKYLRWFGIAGQGVAVVAVFYFWSFLIYRAIPSASSSDIDLVATDYVITSNRHKFGNSFLFPAISSRELTPGTAAFYGYYDGLPEKKMFSCCTNVNWRHLDFSFLSFFVGDPGNGCYRLSLLGDPFSSCSFMQRNVLFRILDKQTPLLLIDTDSCMRWVAADERAFIAKLNDLRSKFQIVFIHPGPWDKYCKDLPLLRGEFADIPVVGCARVTWDFRQAVRQFGSDIVIRKNQQRIVCLSDNVEFMNVFASGLGDYNCVRSVLIKKNYRLPDIFRKGKRQYLFILRPGVLETLDELKSGEIHKIPQ